MLYGTYRNILNDSHGYSPIMQNLPPGVFIKRLHVPLNSNADLHYIIITEPTLFDYKNVIVFIPQPDYALPDASETVSSSGI